MEEQLWQAERRYRDIFEATTVMHIVTRNEAGVPIIADCNTLVSTLLGYTHAELVGRPLSDLYTDESRHLLLDKGGYQDALQGNFVSQERQFLTRSGRIIDTLLHAIPETDAHGRVIGTHAMYVDISSLKRAEDAIRKLNADLERRVAERTAELAAVNRELASEIAERERAELALRESEAMLRAVIAASPDIITLLDPNGVILTQSPAVRTILGYEPETTRGMDSRALVHPDDRVHMEQELQALLNGDKQEDQNRLRYRHADSSIVVIESRGRAMMDAEGQPNGVVIVARNVTDQVHMEDALRQAKEVAESANRAKNEFLSRMSHELRTPLNAILGFAQLLEMDELPPTSNESVQHILKAGLHLLELINEVLDIARIETGKLTLSIEPVFLCETLEEAVNLIGPMAMARNIRIINNIARTCQHYVWADRQRLVQIVSNLLSNAVKYNRLGGTITVLCRPVGPDYMRICVRDTGRGIPAARLDRLFTPFERLGAEQTGMEGTGIGLALSKRLAELMDGRIGCESAVDYGSLFWVDLPTAVAPSESHAASQLDQRETANALPAEWTVLHIEDNLLNLRLIERILAQRPQTRIIPAMQGHLGLELAREHQPHLIMLDLHLPDLPGVEVLERLRNDPRTSATPIVVIGADATEGRIQRLIESGVQGYLTKPLNVKQFFAIIDDIFSGLEKNRDVAGRSAPE